ncbi:NAD(P)-binding domain-containing protein [Cohnella sp. WQ 127256]|uniref:NAD(P)-binding domain-containing protein n=1 Tax=Cohnella sp. WQ 127256 TaxID=2938790 RepID=UPI00211835D7|nr:NAD(P)-binding domain-containing protein [Cohnella sp. WQ 127256]
MKSIGFIGLGTMGEPMAANLLRKGYSVIVYNRSPGKAGQLIELGADEAASPLEVAKRVDVVITMISNDQAIEEVYFGSAGILKELKPGTLIIDCSTISPTLAKRIGTEVSERFSDFIDAPVTGSKPAAIDGTLMFMAGGNEQLIKDHQDIFLTMGKEVIHMGASGSGANAKIAHNTIVGINAAGLIEGMAIAAKSGIDASAFLRVVKSGGAASKQADLKGQKIIEHDFSVQFSLALMLKDLKLSSALTDSLGVSTPMLESAKSLFQLGQAAGHGESDLAALALIYENWIGTKIGEPVVPELTEKQSDDRRKKIRLPLNISIMMSIYQWEGDGGFSGQSVQGYLRNLSEDGIQIESEFPLEKDMFVVIHFLQESQLPPMTGRIIRIERNNGSFKYGCMLTGLPLYQRIQLQEYIISQS